MHGLTPVVSSTWNRCAYVVSSRLTVLSFEIGIDKTSSSELSEAINSMFEWYKRSAVCYVYLPDVSYSCLEESTPPLRLNEVSTSALETDPRATASVDGVAGILDREPVSISEIRTELSSSRWFTRGWTLQELISPPRLQFFGNGWFYIGSLDDLMSIVTSVTEVPEVVLRKTYPFTELSIARRMSWASRRKTTRIEDEAYCLLGLFDVYMPLLYGEGRNAFVRLQKEIIQRSSDQSIFAWDVDITDTGKRHGPTYLASSAADFTESGSYSPLPRSLGQMPYSVNQRGLDISVRVAEIQTLTGVSVFAILDCFDERRPTRLLVINILPVDNSDFRRANEFSARGPWTCTIRLAEKLGQRRRITVINKAIHFGAASGSVKIRALLPRRSKVAALKELDENQLSMRILDTYPAGAWDADASLCKMGVSLAGRRRWPQRYAFTADIWYTQRDSKKLNSETTRLRITVLFWLNSDDVMFADVAPEDSVLTAGSLQRLCDTTRTPSTVLHETITEIPAARMGRSHVNLFRIKSFNFDAYDTLAVVFTPRWSVFESLRQDMPSVVLTGILLPWSLLMAFWSDCCERFGSQSIDDRNSIAIGLNAAEQPGDHDHVTQETQSNLRRLYGSNWRLQKTRASENVDVFLQTMRVRDRPLPVAIRDAAATGRTPVRRRPILEMKKRESFLFKPSRRT